MNRHVKLVTMRSINHAYDDLFTPALERLGATVENVVIPAFDLEDFSPAKLDEIQRLLVPSDAAQQVIYCPGVMELFVPGAHHSLHFSGYCDWHDPTRCTVIPHPWSVHRPTAREECRWRAKPPLSVGFMGTSYHNAALVRLARRLPLAIRRRMLHGRYLRDLRWLARAFTAGVPARFALAFPRIESLDALRRQAAGSPDLTVAIVDTGGFTGQSDAKERYIEAMLAATYALCPRGSENFSFRVYEALQMGRVPVIIDTDMVLPAPFSWHEVALIVPYERLDELGKIIREDHAARDGPSFARRQAAAFAAMDALIGDRWLDAVLAPIIGVDPR